LKKELLMIYVMNTLTRRRYISAINSRCESNFEDTGPELEVGCNRDESDDGSSITT